MFYADEAIVLVHRVRCFKVDISINLQTAASNAARCGSYTSSDRMQRHKLNKYSQLGPLYPDRVAISSAISVIVVGPRKSELRGRAM